MSEDDSRSAEPRSILRSSSMTDMQWQCSASDELMGSDEVRLSLCERFLSPGGRGESRLARLAPRPPRLAARGARRDGRFCAGPVVADAHQAPLRRVAALRLI